MFEMEMEYQIELVNFVSTQVDTKNKRYGKKLSNRMGNNKEPYIFLPSSVTFIAPYSITMTEKIVITYNNLLHKKYFYFRISNLDIKE